MSFQDYPLDIPANPIPAPRGAVGKQALTYYKAATEARARVEACNLAEQEAAAALRAAREDLHAEVQRGGREGTNAERELELAREVDVRERLADPSTHRSRRWAAVGAQREAASNWLRFVGVNVEALVRDELASEAENASADLLAARAKVAPVEAAYAEVAARVRALVAFKGTGQNGSAADAIAAEWRLAEAPEAPLPPAYLWAHVDGSDPS